MRAQPLQPVGIVERVDLVRRDDHRLVLQLLAGGVAAGKQRQLAHDHVEVLDRIAAARRRDVDEVDQHLGAFEVAQEAVAEAVARVRAFDQPGHVGDDEAPVAGRPTTPRFGLSVVKG